MELRIKQGILSGADLGGCKVFYDVPYASDNGRFQIAGEAPCWNEIRDASRPGPVFLSRPPGNDPKMSHPSSRPQKKP